jgi:hypothetical protein
VYRSYKIGDVKFGVRTTSKAFGAWLDSVLARYRYRRTANLRYSIVVSGGEKDGQSSGKRFHILYRATAQQVRTLDLPTLGRAFLAELESVRYTDRDDALYLEASPVVADGMTALISPAYASAISRLGRRVEQAGFQLPVARILAVDMRSGRLVPPTPELELPGDALDQLHRIVGGNGQESRLAALEEPRTVDVVAVGGNVEEPPQPISRANAMYHLGAFAVNLPKLQADDALKGLSRLVEGARCFGVAGAQSRELLAFLTEFMRA